MKIKLLILSSIVILLLCVLPPITAQVGETYYVNVKSAIVRENPKTTAKKVTTLKRNEYVVVLEVVEGDKVFGNSKWYWVSTGRFEGYIHSSLVTDKPPAVSGIPSASTPIPARSSSSCPHTSATCSQLTCSQAYACLSAGNGSLDRDNDGVPCESVCK